MSGFDSLPGRLALAFSPNAGYGLDPLHPVCPLGRLGSSLDLGWPSAHVIRTSGFATAGTGPRCANISVLEARHNRLCSGAVLVSDQGAPGTFCVRLGALDAAALSLRSTDALRVEGPVSRGALECGPDEPCRGDAQMTPQLVIFLVLAAIAVAGAVSVILQREPIHSAISLITVMIALAGLFLLLESEFIAAVQIIVYAGAIMVLFVFVIMLLNAGAEERTNTSRMARYVGVPLAIFLLIELAYQVGTATLSMTAQPAADGATRGLSMLLFQDFVFPFELTSILILIAILGALVLAQRSEGASVQRAQQ